MKHTDKEFTKCIKRYLADISNRTMQDAYFNLLPDTIVICNSSSNKAGTAFGDRLTNFAVGELSLHLIKFKNTEFLDIFKQVFKIPAYGVYAINAVKLVTLTNKTSIDKLHVFMNNNVLSVVPDDIFGEYDEEPTLDCLTDERILDRYAIGKSVTDFHVLDVLTTWCNYILTLNEEDHRNKFPYVLSECSYSKSCLANYVLKIDLTEFGDVLKNYHETLNYIMHDGLSTPSRKSFVLNTGKLYRYSWLEANSIFNMYIYDDDVVHVRTIRPNVRVMPIPKLVDVDKLVTDFQYE